MSVQPFDSFNDAMNSLRRDMNAVDARVQFWQAAIKPGDYYTQATEWGFPIYGQVLPDEEQRESHVRHYRLCNANSIACLDGEMGEVHVSVIERLLSESEFTDAKGRGGCRDLGD